MKTLRIVGVPEHFNFPFRLLEKDQPLKEKGVEIQWIDESRGSGQMNLALRNDEADIAILLTESFLKDFEAGNPAKMIGYHVETPLNWGIHIRAKSPVNSIYELNKKHFLVSRMGSGSHLMALVLARREGWKLEELTFEMIGNMEGAKEVMDRGNDGIFLWEKYTTAALVKSGTMKRIGEVPSPWPCFVMVASEKALSEFGDVIFELRDKVYQISKAFSKHENRAATLAAFYHLDLIDVERWLEQTRWCTEGIVSREELETAIKTMKELGILQNELSLEHFLTLDGLSLKS
ncbi:MAG: ABC transporter substrate-binding protein [Algoriphagus sp.]|jgi:ABC-type nitrate/sulfonate/bicarbonate transport system substrate-binding protein|uniref:ABC transporter substrate-binding protein n=1 Tax=Algoriphagus sp. TaxID=1872435 RepID=UPI0027301317|nr:ABC transporter substrate-binding protein [Algoriphagus sp.]MDP2041627.1 ABC transporter substrate-binding protein [Algoriphagus sp.]MDP3472639.1 ABC transporter substrate-binding protein [Algoriphagus sp.]